MGIPQCILLAMPQWRCSAAGQRSYIRKRNAAMGLATTLNGTCARIDPLPACQFRYVRHVCVSHCVWCQCVTLSLYDIVLWHCTNQTVTFTYSVMSNGHGYTELLDVTLHKNKSRVWWTLDFFRFFSPSLSLFLPKTHTHCHIRSWGLGHLPFINWGHVVFVCS